MMTDIEERLRHDLKIVAERAQHGSIRPLRVPPATPRPRAVHWLAPAMRRRRTARWLAPATAMAAVIAIIVGVSLAGTGNRPAVPGSTAGMPKYYVTLKTVLRKTQPIGPDGDVIGFGPGSVTAIVRDSLTGALLDSVQIEHIARGEDWGNNETWITAAANDRVFAISVAGHVYILRLQGDGQVARLRGLPAAMSKTISGNGQPAVLSPAGTELAFVNQTARQLYVVTLATGAIRAWQARPGFLASGGTLQWQGTGNEVFIQYVSQSGPVSIQFRLLDVAGAGGRVLANSRLVYRKLPPFLRNGYDVQVPLIMPNGNLLFDARSVYTKRGGVETTACRVVEFSSDAGRLLRVLYKAHAPSSKAGYFPPCGVVSVGPTGLNLLIENMGYGRLDGGRITALPGWADNGGWPQAAW
jgi:hypothetical protein